MDWPGDRVGRCTSVNVALQANVWICRCPGETHWETTWGNIEVNLGPGVTIPQLVNIAVHHRWDMWKSGVSGEVNGKYNTVSLYIFSLYTSWH